MQFGICLLSTVAVRPEPQPEAAIVNQLLYGDLIKIKEERKFWSRIATVHDNYEGWVLNIQLQKISEAEFADLKQQNTICNADLVAFITDTSNHSLTAIPFGATVSNIDTFKHTFDGHTIATQKEKAILVEYALLYLNCPYLKVVEHLLALITADTQMIYKLAGINLKRPVAEQAMQGEPLSFIEESEPGDLAFFDNKEGEITHVGLILKDNYIIHCYGKVRIDRIDHTGIFNNEVNNYTHQLRVIKQIF